MMDIPFYSSFRSQRSLFSLISQPQKGCRLIVQTCCQHSSMKPVPAHPGLLDHLPNLSGTSASHDKEGSGFGISRSGVFRSGQSGLLQA